VPNSTMPTNKLYNTTTLAGTHSHILQHEADAAPIPSFVSILLPAAALHSGEPATYQRGAVVDTALQSTTRGAANPLQRVERPTEGMSTTIMASHFWWGCASVRPIDV